MTGGIGSIRGGALALLLLLALAPAACAPSPEEQARRSIESGQAVREIQAHFDKAPGGQCAAVLTGISPIEIGERTARLDTVRALVDTGLLEAAPGAPQGETRLLPTIAAKAWFRERRGNSALPPGLELCYARRQVTRAWLVGEDGKTLNFAYRLVDAPAWTKDPRMRAAFPFLAPALSQELVATGIAPFRDGRWFLDLADQGITLPGHDEGFYACPDDRDRPDPGCGG